MTNIGARSTIDQLRERLEHRQRKYDDAIRYGAHKYLRRLRLKDLDEAKREYAAAIAAQQKEERCKQ